MEKILILGSTGSIGVNTLNVIRNFPDRFKVVGLSANNNIDLLERQIEEFKPEFAVVTDLNAGKKLKDRIKGKCKIFIGKDTLVSISSETDYDVFVGAMVGFCGLAPTIEAVKRGKKIALANKETLVVAGNLITGLAKKFNSSLIPIDSEHSAIFQCLAGEKEDCIEKIILTASGGPFLNRSKSELDSVTVQEALNHPNWKMGNKITIDSASMMNKGLEVIEAFWLFNVSPENIDVVIHPQSIIHSMVQFVDGSIKAQLGLPDMKLPIQYALTYPSRLKNNFVRSDLPEIAELTFLKPDLDKFKCLKLAYEALKEGGNSACVLNAANEVAVDKFLKGQIKFPEIPELIEKALEQINFNDNSDLNSILECDKITRNFLK